MIRRISFKELNSLLRPNGGWTLNGHVRWMRKMYRAKLNTVESDDYFGVKYITKEEVQGEKLPDDHAKHREKLKERYGWLRTRRDAMDNEEHFIRQSYGILTRDSDNIPLYHGQYDDENETLVSKRHFDNFENELLAKNDEDNKCEESIALKNQSETNDNYIEKHFFKHTDDDKQEEKSTDEGDLSFIDFQYFKKYDFNKPKLPSKFDFRFTQGFHDYLMKEDDEAQRLMNLSYEERMKEEESKNYEADDEMKMKLDNQAKQFNYQSPLKNMKELEKEMLEIKIEEEEDSHKFKLEEESLGEKVIEPEPIVEVPEPKTAYDYLKQIKLGQREPATEELKKIKLDTENGDTKTSEPYSDIFIEKPKKLDSKGFKTYSHQIKDLHTLTYDELLWYLKKRIIFDDCGIVAIDKPYGLVCQGKKKDGYTPSLADMLVDFAELIKKKHDTTKPVLHIVHRLDKEVTGVLLLARNQQVASQLGTYFKNRVLQKLYWCITKAIPDPKEGLIDIPMEVGVVSNKQRMLLRPEISENYRRLVAPSKHSLKALTYYKVLDEHNNAALVEVKPETGVKHQIRCHLGLGLRTPILGDHKYTYLDRIAPQQLPADMLIAFGVRQAKVRTIPMHLHCKRVIIPELNKHGGAIVIHAHLPRFFKDNISILGLQK